MPSDVLLKIWKRGKKEELDDGKIWPTLSLPGDQGKAQQ